MGELLLPPFHTLRRELPEFKLDTAAAEIEGLDEYTAYYRLDMAQEFPGTSHRCGWVESSGEKLATHLWCPPEARGNLLLVHGYFDHVGLFGQLLRFGLEQGFNVAAFDLPGHGISTGARGEVADFSHYARSVADVLVTLQGFADDWDIIAQSTGGAAVMDLLSGPDTVSGPGRVVLLAPLLRPRGWWWIRLAHSLLGGRRDSVPRGFPENSHDADFLAFVRSDPLQAKTMSVAWVGALRQWLPGMLQRPPCAAPLLVLQGDEDRTVGWKYNLQEIARLFPNAQLKMIPAGRHHLANESPEIRRQLCSEIAGWLAPDAPG